MDVRSLKRVFLGHIALTLILGVTAGFLAGRGVVSGVLAAKMLFAFVIVSMVAALPLAFRWWSKVDEAVREAHKWAWFWGGSTGLLLVLPLNAAFMLTDWAFYRQYLALLHVRDGFGEFAAGILTAVLCMSIGYVIAWAYWWWKRR